MTDHRHETLSPAQVGSSNYEPKGIVFWASGSSMMLVSDEEKRESLRGWLLYRHPDGQWVTLRKATAADTDALYNSGHVEGGKLVASLSFIPDENWHAWARPPAGTRSDIVGIRRRRDGQIEYLMHNEALICPYYVAVNGHPAENI